MSSFSLSRDTVVAAAPEAVLVHLDDFRRWQAWSPWEGVDPDLSRTYSGPTRGVGAHYRWAGNSKAGEGTMEILESTPERVVVDLRFIKPFKAVNVSRFDLVPDGAHTRVTWTMTGQRNVLMQVLGRLFFDKAIGGDFERGLADLTKAVESA